MSKDSYVCACLCMCCLWVGISQAEIHFDQIFIITEIYQAWWLTSVILAFRCRDRRISTSRHRVLGQPGEKKGCHSKLLNAFSEEVINQLQLGFLGGIKQGKLDVSWNGKRLEIFIVESRKAQNTIYSTFISEKIHAKLRE